MALVQLSQHCREKQRLFEYFVIQLDQWKKEVSVNNIHPFSKLQLQKLLFLTSAQEATQQSHPMLDMFDRFYALKYGPVEMDIYDAMTQGTFESLSFGERSCQINNEKTDFLKSIPVEQKTMVDNAISMLRKRNSLYILKDPFELVEITHGWTAWQVAMMIADMLNSKMERMTTSDICNSSQKIF
ncbi:MAG: SocA family protein [Prevotella sp.]|nr:SocA family protein [Prevotella sp.]